MTPEQTVVARPIAEELKRVGFGQQSLWYWECRKGIKPILVWGEGGKFLSPETKDCHFYAAPTASELLEILPHRIHGEGYDLLPEKPRELPAFYDLYITKWANGHMRIGYFSQFYFNDENNPKFHRKFKMYFDAKTLSDALGKMALHLYKQGVI